MTEPGEGRAWRRLALRVLGSFVVLGILLWVLPFDEVASALGRVPIWVWFVSVPTYLGLHGLGITKWRMLINTAQGGLRVRDAVRCYYFGLFGNTFLPSLIGGDAVRVGLALKLAPGKAGVVMGSVIDRVVDVLGLATIAGIGALLLPGALDPQSRRVFWMLAGGVALLGSAVLLFAVLMPFERLPYRVRRIAVKLRGLTRELARQPGPVLTALILGLTLQTSLVAMNWWLGQQCGIDIAFKAWLFAWPMAKISALVPVSQGGIGVREAALAALLAPFGVSSALAVAAGLVFQAVVLSGGLLGGLISTLMGRVGVGDPTSDARADFVGA